MLASTVASDFAASDDASAFVADKALSPRGKYQPTRAPVTVTFRITLRSFILSCFFMSIAYLCTKLFMNLSNVRIVSKYFL